MSITLSRSFGNVTDNGLLFSNIEAEEVRTTSTNSVLGDAGLAPNPFVGPFAGLNWTGFVGGVTDANQSLKVTISYDVTALDAAQGITAIRSNSILPDTLIPVGVRYSVVQEILDADGNVIGRSVLDRSAADNDTQDPPLEAGDFQLTRAYNSVQVRLTVEVISDGTAAPGTTASFSAIRQAYDPGLPAGLGDYVFEDVNQNGIQDAGDVAIAGVTVQLLDGNGNQIDETTTNGVGYYEFTNLVAGDYSVRFVTPAGYAPTAANEGGDDALDSDAVGGVTQEITLAAGEFNGTLDAGFFRPVIIGDAGLGDYVFEDNNRDGIQDAGDVAISGVTVQLLDDSGNQVDETTTDAVGYYQFIGLIPGSYSVRFVAPAGYTATLGNQGGDDAADSDAVGGVTQEVTLTSGEFNGTLDAGFFRPAGLGDSVFEDVNRNGIQDAGDVAIAGVTVQLLDGNGDQVDETTTDAVGYYQFIGLIPGSYSVRFVTPSGYTPTLANQGGDDTLDSDAMGGITQQVTLTSGEFNGTLDAGFFRPAGLGDYVFEDTNRNGIQDAGDVAIAGVTVQLLDGNGNQVDETTTDGTGFYQFVNLVPGDYSVRFVTPSGYTPTLANQGGDDALDSDAVGGITQQVTLTSGEFNGTLDAGFFRPAGLGDYVFEDTNRNGIQDAGDVAIAGVTVQLLDGSGDQVDETTTDGTGFYQFVDLVPGDYSVRFVTPSGYTPTLANQGGDDALDSDAVGGITQQVTLTSGEFNGTLDAGFFRPAGLGDYVFEDVNRNGIQDAGDVAIAGVTVQLLDGSGNQVDETTTDGTGFYQFTNLVPGDYSVRFVTPSGYTPTLANQGGDDALDSDAVGGITQQVTLASGEFNGTLDAGFFRPAGLGDYVFEDVNRNGIQDAGDVAIAGVTVQLLDGSGNQVDETTTDAVGYYEFTNLIPGDYSVRFVTPSGYTPTLANQGGDDGLDSDAVGGVTQQVTLSSGEFNGTLDAGFFRPAGLGDYVFEDVNRNGIQDAGDVAISGVTVQLLDGNGNQVDETTTDGTGFYQFTNLVPGDYSVRFVTPSGYTPTLANQGGDDALDSDAVGGITQQVTLTSGEFNGTLDAGFYKPTRSLDLEKTTNGPSNSNTTAPDYDNEDLATGAGVPTLVAGSSVTWTYQVTNTGESAFAASEITLVDDNGTPGDAADDMSIANGMIVRQADAVGNNDDVLDAGEVWIYEASGVVQALGSVGAATTFAFGGNTATDGTDGNTRSYSSGGVSVKASAFSRDANGTWEQAYLGAYGGGLGVTDTSEGSGSGTRHTVDNTGRDNYVVFAFDQIVIPDAAYLGYVVDDSDMRLWIGTLADPFNTTITLSDSVLAGLGFTEVNETTSSSARWADFNAGNVAGNVLVIAANTGEPTTEDNFKIEKVKVTPAGDGIYKNVATVSAPDTPSDSDASHYRNGPPPAPPKPGLDLEKTTNGPSNSNPVAPDYDNEDAANGAGVPLLVAGSSVTWTYKVTNTGGTTFAANEIVLVDDNGTASTADDMSIANGKIVRKADELGNNDNVLDPGEVWIYEATGVVKSLTTPGVTTTFDFSGNSWMDGSDGNVRSWSSDGISVKASAFSRVESTGAWHTAFLGAYGGGLGVTDRSEGDGSGSRHTVDNNGRDNFVLFRFDQQVVVDKAYLGYVVCDSDMSVWIGTIDNAFNTTVTLTDSVLTGLGFYELNSTSSGNARWADINNANLSGNVIVIAASVEDKWHDDYFKIEKLAVAKPATSGVYANEATVSAQGVSDSDLSHYKNGAPPAPGINLEKSTNGATNSNPVAPDWDNEDMADGIGVPVLTPGSTVTWTYKVTNTGGTVIKASDIKLVDDNGTTSTSDDMSIANGRITLTAKQDGNQDNLLDPGETWLYRATGTVNDLTSWGSATTFDFSGNSATDGSDGNVRTYTVGDISVKASAFSEVSGGFATAWLGAYGGGLGVTDRSEGSGSGDLHTVDNVGRENFVLFRFNQDVVVDKAYLGYVVGDSDISVWIGSIDNAFNTAVSLNSSVLNGLGFYEVNNTTSSSARWADINAGNLSGNVLVVAASLADTTPDDRFKLEKLVVYKEPEIEVYENTATVWVPGASDSDVSHYTNPDIWH